MDKAIHPYKPKLKEVDLEAVSTILCQCGSWDVPKSNKSAGMITFTGKYGVGSSGHDDALFIKWRIQEFLEIEPVWGLVVDFQGLHYVWGDEMMDVIPLEFDGGDNPLRVVVSEQNREPLSGVLDAEDFREDLGIACAEINHSVRTMKGR